MWQVGLPSPATFFATRSLRAILQLQEEGCLECHFTSPPTRLLQPLFHSLLQVITKEKDKMAPLGFTSPVEVPVVSFTNHYRPEEREGKGREAVPWNSYQEGIRTRYLACQLGAHGRSVEKTQMFK